MVNKLSISKIAKIYASLFIAATLAGASNAAAEERKNLSGEAVVNRDSTNIDFSAANIDGKMQAPNGFFLQGRQAQSMTQMVKLRSKFRSELRNSKSAVKDLVK